MMPTELTLLAIENAELRSALDREALAHDKLTNLAMTYVVERDKARAENIRLSAMAASLPSRFQIGEKVRYGQQHGVVCAVTITASKIFYDVNCAGKIYPRLPSDDVTNALSVVKEDA
jgi:hypothetical protein